MLGIRLGVGLLGGGLAVGGMGCRFRMGVVEEVDMGILGMGMVLGRRIEGNEEEGCVYLGRQRVCIKVGQVAPAHKDSDGP